VAPSDIDFGWQPHTVAPDLKSFSFQSSRRKKRNRKKLDGTFGI
jgi:hypothetical protein